MRTRHFFDESGGNSAPICQRRDTWVAELRAAASRTKSQGNFLADSAARTIVMELARLQTKLETVSGGEAAIGRAHVVGNANTVQLTLLLSSLSDPLGELIAQVWASSDGQNWSVQGTVTSGDAEAGHPQTQAFTIPSALYRITVETTPVDNVASYAIDVVLSEQ